MPPAITINPNGTVRTMILNGLADYQREVEGYIENVPVSEGCRINVIANEEGQLRGMPVNTLAMRLLAGIPGGYRGLLVGPVVVVGNYSDDSEDWIDIPADIERAIITASGNG